jgi:hypothetical protein
MIIGIILLFSTAIVVYIRAQVVDAEVREFQPVVEEVPLQAKPIKAYVEQCVYDLGLEAVEKVGMQGGWIDFDDVELNGGEYFKDIPLPAEGDLTKGVGPQKTTYWNYVSSRNRDFNNPQCGSKRPELESSSAEGSERGPYDTSIEAQIDRYIQKNIDDCLDGFRSFNVQAINVKSLDDPVVTTIVTDQDVSINLVYPLEMISAAAKTNLNIFNANIPVNLRKIYSLALGITKAEANTLFLEYGAMALMDLYMGADRKKLPPISSNPSIVTTKYPIWVMRNVKNFLESHIIPQLALKTRIFGTKNFDFLSIENVENSVIAEMTQGQELVHVRNIEDFLEGVYNFSDLNLDIFYTGEDAYLDIKPSNGVIVTPQTMDIDFKLFHLSTTEYGYKYFLSYPYVVVIEDPEALNGRGYFFQFALESNIRANNGFNCSKPITVLNRGGPKNLFGKYSQRLSGNITVETVDHASGGPLPGVLVSFACGPASTVIGGTELVEVRDPATNYMVEKAILEENYPLCPSGGTLELSKLTYMTLKIPFNTFAAGTPAYLMFTME